MARKVQPKPDTAEIQANSIEYLATSIEAIGARLRASIGKPGAWRVLNWSADELDRLGTEGRDIADEARLDESETT
jgi:hypothetical protein